MADSSFVARRTTRTYRQTINAAPDKVFPLICPVREAEWLDGWRYSMIYSHSGRIEAGAVFSTPREGEPDTVWIVTRHDPGTREVEFVRFTPDSRICVLTIAIRPIGERKSSVDIAYTYTATTAAGNDFIERLTDDAFLAGVVFWERSMNHFLETGRKLIRS